MGTTDFLLMLALFVVLALYGIWKYDKAETNDYKRFVEKASELSNRMTKLERACLEENSQVFVNALTRIEQLEIKSVASFQQIDATQDHCSRLREQMIELRDRSYPRKVEVSFPVVGAVPVEIRGPVGAGGAGSGGPIGKPKKLTPPEAKKLLKKTAKQIKALSK
jgi:hypothetical protein